MTEVRVFGIRHHGPGSARALVAALDSFDPDAVLVEGPADADGLLGLVGVPGVGVDAPLTPPVAILAYAVDRPAHSAFWPFALFSPEWQALCWAGEHKVPARFLDLPAAQQLAHRAPRAQDETGAAVAAGDSEEPADGASSANGSSADDPYERLLRDDPLLVLAQASGYDDAERWWDELIEGRAIAGAHRGGDPFAPFELITEAMSELRRARGIPVFPTDDERFEEAREAHMRQVLRQTLKTGAQRVAVVCGAWHAPALAGRLPPAAQDARLLRGLPKVKVATAWIPWTHGRLARASGYGAGVTSPGWYAHLFEGGEHPVAAWLTAVAHRLRATDLPVSSAHVIEGVRLAEALAALRGRALPGLDEITDATRSVLCEGQEVLVDLVTREMVVGERLGHVPEGAATVPVETDLAALSRRLRMPREASVRDRELDLRRTLDQERSQVLHRLRLLDIPWGRPAQSTVQGTGTFRETWQTRWMPEFAVEVVEASAWGSTVEAAATNRAISQALGADLPGLTALVERALLAQLGDALPDLVAALDARAARDQDVQHLLDAVPPLVRAGRYGDVRGTDTAALSGVADALVVRACAGLPAAVGSLDDDAAAALVSSLTQVAAAVELRDDPDLREHWFDSLARLTGRADVHGLIAGRVTRLLLDAGRVEPGRAGDALARALSVGSEPASKAAWVEGFLAGSGLLLVHDPVLLALIDGWLSKLDGEDFLTITPLLRRTFGAMQRTERRALGAAVATLDGSGAVHRAAALAVDAGRAAGALARAAGILGVPFEGEPR